MTIRSSVDDDGQRVWVTLGDEPSRLVFFAPELKTRLSRAEYEQLLDIR